MTSTPDAEVFLTVGYGDGDGYGRTQPGLRNTAPACDSELVAWGAISGTAGAPVPGAQTTTGPASRPR